MHPDVLAGICLSNCICTVCKNWPDRLTGFPLLKNLLSHLTYLLVSFLKCDLELSTFGAFLGVLLHWAWQHMWTILLFLSHLWRKTHISFHHCLISWTGVWWKMIGWLHGVIILHRCVAAFVSNSRLAAKCQTQINSLCWQLHTGRSSLYTLLFIIGEKSSQLWLYCL